MSVLSEHHRTLDETGQGKCSVPMWSGGSPAGFCDRPAYGERPKGDTVMNYSAGRPMRADGRFDGYVPSLACACHGGPLTRAFKDGDAWCAVRHDFINLQESPSGWGATPEAARADLAKATA